MYTGYFGLEEKPFSIAPNPDYLFMSDRHREALNHLTYGLGDTGGFVLLTGEVGTGKTTISRCLMENLPENTQAAFILNPTLSSQELLATICDELKIRYRKTGATLKTLTDKIQQKLLKNHSENINTLLIIDEAQHLEPEVIEQLRLLTNLETNTKKLLQVILIGQPELQQLLQRRDLRQLAQRITARYHLLPLNRLEVEQYIKHRLSVAKCFRNIFDKNAISAIHKTCKGIPRLMNLLAERALINAYNSNNAVVNRKMILQAAHDALGDEYQVTPWWQTSMFKWSISSCVIALTLFIGVWWGVNNSNIKEIEVADLNVSAKIVTENSANEISAVELRKTIEENAKNEVLADVTAPAQHELTSEREVPIDDNVVNSRFSQEELAADSNTLVNTDQYPGQSNRAVDIIRTPEQIDKADKIDDFAVTASDDVSDELLARFQSAIEQTKPTQTSAPETSEHDLTEIQTISQMPTWVQDGIPALQFEMHIYASDGQGWVRVNGRDRYEGDYIGRELLLNEIRPQHVVLSFRGEKFTMAALSSWN